MVKWLIIFLQRKFRKLNVKEWKNDAASQKAEAAAAAGTGGLLRQAGQPVPGQGADQL